MNQEKVLSQLKNQVVNLLDDLLSICPNEPDLLLVRIFFENQVAADELMEGFLEWVYPWGDYIRKRDMNYFEENDHMFGPLPPEKVAHFKVKLKDGTFEQEDIDTIWDYFEVFLGLMEEYRKLQ